MLLSTHFPQLLDAFRGTIPATTIFEWVDDHTELQTLAGEDLQRWVQDYSLGKFCFSGEAEAPS